jgi:predicted dehydrogenase/threonine dehydrogenase-like Zn-dependent dehydrogenase
MGTEMAGVRMSGLPLYRRALKQPEHARRVLQLMRDQGFKRTFQRVRGQLAAGLPTGYSAAGEVLQVGEQVDGFRAGDLVACAGAGIANHAEVIDVPVNLATRIPSELSTEAASTVTLGAIALQGVRRTNPTLGETVVVIGLGLLGQLTAQLLKANGCRVIGTDLDTERIRLAVENGLDFGISPAAEEDFVDRVYKLTDGFGADAVIVTAATSSNEVISQAMKACRKKGRVVLVGDVGLDLKRSDLYNKELDFLISCSYGPGRYDARYEEGGQDYPLPYVRWTENRNMEEYLRLLAEGRVTLARMQPQIFPVDRAADAFELLKGDGSKPLLALLEYPKSETALQRTISLNPPSTKKGRLGIAVVGAGGFAQAMHLPNLMKLKSDFDLRCVMSRTGANARAAGASYQAGYATSDYERVLDDPEVDVVLIATRHHLHGSMALQALRAGKHVFVEKPLTIFPGELTSIEDFYRDHRDPPLLMTGFNRRFSPAIAVVKRLLAARTTPLIVNYRMNAGYVPPDHWVHSEEGGGRNLGEACHIYDLFSALTNSKMVAVTAHSIVSESGPWRKNDNFVATLSYRDGSVCSLTYTALGHKSFPKETMEIFADGKVISMEDYKTVSVSGGNQKSWKSLTQEKGQLEELRALADALLRGKASPISLESQFENTRIAFAVEEQIVTQCQSRGSFDVE